MAEAKVEIYTGVIVGYRRGTNTQYEKQMLIRVDGINSRNKASKLIGWKVAYRDKNGRVFRGKIVRVHGNNGIVIAVFNPPLPGQAIGNNVYIYPKGVILEF